MKHPVCATCGVAMKTAKPGATVVETYLDPPEPYRAISGDLFECPGCGARVVARWAKKESWHVSRGGEPPGADVVENEKLGWTPTEVELTAYRPQFYDAEPTLQVMIKNPCDGVWHHWGAVREPFNENPILDLARPFGVRGVRRILAELEKWRREHERES